MLKLGRPLCLIVAATLANATGLTCSALAADISAPAPVYTKAAPPPAWSWTGLYVGGNLGYGWGRSSDSSSAAQADSGVPQLFLWSLSPGGANNVSGLIGGGQVGYNWQVTNFLFGLEADIQGSGQKHTGQFGSALAAPGLGDGINPAALTDTSKLDWFGTLRGRLGMLASPRWLVYATGGLAYGNINETGVAAPLSPFSIVPINEGSLVWSQSKTKVGWTAGAGVENALSANWSWKIEYLYMDLGNITSNVSGGAGNCYAAPGAGVCDSVHGAFGSITSKFTDNVVRVGVNYAFH